MAKSYARLFGISDYDEKELFSVKEVADFICEEGKNSDVSIYQENGSLLLNTFGLFINKITDMEYRDLCGFLRGRIGRLLCHAIRALIR